jgi:hypothetical protein
LNSHTMSCSPSESDASDSEEESRPHPSSSPTLSSKIRPLSKPRRLIRACTGLLLARTFQPAYEYLGVLFQLLDQPRPNPIFPGALLNKGSKKLGCFGTPRSLLEGLRLSRFLFESRSVLSFLNALWTQPTDVLSPLSSPMSSFSLFYRLQSSNSLPASNRPSINGSSPLF